MLFYEIKDQIEEINIETIKEDNLTVGIVSPNELESIYSHFNFDLDTIETSKNVNTTFRSNVDVRNDYSYGQLRIYSHEKEDDYIALFIKKNLLLVVDILDKDNSTKDSLIKALHRYPGNKMSLEKLICYFIVSLLNESSIISEKQRNKLSSMEEKIISGEANKDINIELLNTKKAISNYYNYYNQLLDFIETLEDNDNEILNEDNIIYITNLYTKVNRIKEDFNNLNENVEHLQDAYNTYLDQRMNNTMKIFTIMTSIFFPLTIIVGWYGMNFIYMPELSWRYGYIYVIFLSLVISITLILIAKKKKWF